MDRDLGPVELRVLGCLLEKEVTTPDQYPLSVNALVQASNQKSNRDPVLALPEADVREAVSALTRRGLVRQASSYGGRVSKFEHRLGRGSRSALDATPEQLAVLCLLLLRGPQTPGELRTRARRLAEFSDLDAVETTLASLAGHPAGPLAESLAREAGKREVRWRHCLGAAGPEAASPAAAEPSAAAPTLEAGGTDASIEDRVARLERIVEALEQRLARGDDEA